MAIFIEMIKFIDLRTLIASIFTTSENPRRMAKCTESAVCAIVPLLLRHATRCHNGNLMNLIEYRISYYLSGSLRCGFCADWCAAPQSLIQEILMLLRAKK